MASASAAAAVASDATIDSKEVIEYYSKNVALCSESVKELVDVTTKAMDRMLKYINTMDARFEQNPIGAGSHKQALKVGKADEFDYNIKLRCDTSSWLLSSESVTDPRQVGGSSAADRNSCLPKIGGPPPSPLGGRNWKFNKITKDPIATMDATLKIVDTNQPLPPPRSGYTFVLKNCVGGDGPTDVPWEDLCYESDVTPFLVRRRLRKLMEQAIQRGELLDIKCKLKRRLSGPALTFIITTPANEHISVDLVPFFDLPHLWPYGSDWPREATKKWLSQTKIDKIKAKGVQLVPKRNFYWLISFNFAETELLDEIDTGNCYRRHSLRIVKQLSSTHWCKMAKPPVSSYLLKFQLGFKTGISKAQPPRLSQRLESATPLRGKIAELTVEPGSIAS